MPPGEPREWWWLPLVVSAYILVALAFYVMVSLAIQITPLIAARAITRAYILGRGGTEWTR